MSFLKKNRPVQPSAATETVPAVVAQKALNEVEFHSREYWLLYCQKLLVQPQFTEPMDSLERYVFKDKMLHTNRIDSFEMIKALMQYLSNHEIATTEEIRTYLGVSMPPLLKRLSILQQHKFILRKQRIYYLPTPRLQSFVTTELPRWEKEVRG